MCVGAGFKYDNDMLGVSISLNQLYALNWWFSCVLKAIVAH